ncbi:hypothetical protein [Prauserella cavernicola]|uniref:Uncharacterized protein n=1 Tax=Prauserella cavernicola TaxID=2800127 RepID=A0A934R060_9PSEU|nr:hypothetical protein [Prauserella cavernicola]MBK1788438.1 hypothetical protein [Prauserella cavernicola]
MSISGAGDRARLARAVEEARVRADRFAPDDWSDLAYRARREVADIEAWERRRSGRAVRLWTARLEVRAAALDEDDAQLRLAGYLRHPFHRTGDRPSLYYVDTPERCGEPAKGERERLDADYPWSALEYLARREPYGPFERAHVDHYADSLTSGRARLLARHGERNEPALVARGPLPPGTRLGYWRVRQRVRFLAGPGEAHPRADELAGTIVDGTGRQVATVTSVEADDGYPSPADGHWVHPADGVGPFGAGALWDDYDAAEHDTGLPGALASVLGRAAEHLRAAFHRDAADCAVPDAAREARSAALRNAAERARSIAEGKPPSELRRLAAEADRLAGHLDDENRGEDAERLRHQAAIYRRLSVAES